MTADERVKSLFVFGWRWTLGTTGEELDVHSTLIKLNSEKCKNRVRPLSCGWLYQDPAALCGRWVVTPSAADHPNPKTQIHTPKTPIVHLTFYTE